MQNAHEQVKLLVAEAMNAIVSPDTSLSSILYRAIRIARLRGDAENLAWIELELRTSGDTGARDAIQHEITQMIGKDGMSRIGTAMMDRFITERTMPSVADTEKCICGMGVAELEERIAYFENVISRSRIPEGNWHHQDLYAKWEESQKLLDTLMPTVTDFRQILARVRHRLNEYLSQVEQELLFVDSGRDAFERVRQLVERRMQRVAPDALAQFVSAYRRQREGDTEARSHALTSCRRILKTLADALYPATTAEVLCSDGRTRRMTEDRYVSRLLQFAFERSESSSSRALATAQLQDLGTRLEAINALTSKGVHSEVSSVETDQCILATYLVVADLLILDASWSTAPLADGSRHPLASAEA